MSIAVPCMLPAARRARKAARPTFAIAGRVDRPEREQASARQKRDRQVVVDAGWKRLDERAESGGGEGENPDRDCGSGRLRVATGDPDLKAAGRERAGTKKRREPRP